MIDQCSIAIVPDRIQINPALIDDPKFKLDGWLAPLEQSQDLQANRKTNTGTPVFHSWFDLFKSRALRVHTRTKEGLRPDRSKQYIYLIEINLRTILWGHNGITLRDGEEICVALGIARHALKQLLADPGQASQLIPGLPGNQTAYWNRLEIAMDVTDPEQELFRQLERMRSPGIRKRPKFFENTLALSGVNVELKVYNKVVQMRDRHKIRRNQIEPVSDGITRLEATLDKFALAKIAETIRSDSLLTTGIRKEPVLTGFTWDALREIHRHYFGKVKAVYSPRASKRAGNVDRFAAVLARIASETGMPTEDILDIYVDYSSNTNESRRDMRQKMEHYFSLTSTLNAEELLSDDAYQTQPLIRVGGVEGCDFYLDHYGNEPLEEAAREITNAYGGPFPSKKFNPLGLRTRLIHRTIETERKRIP